MKRTLFISQLVLVTLFVYSQQDTVRFDYGRSGIGAELGPCTGLGFLYGNSQESINCDCFANVGVIYTHNKMHYSIRMAGMSGFLKDDLDFGTEWRKNYDFNSMNLEMSVGYQILDIKRFNIIPMITGGLKSFNIREDVGEDVTKTNYYGTISFSSAIDIKFHLPVKEKNKCPGSEYTIQYLYIRLIGGIYPNYFKNPFGLDGGIYYFNLSLGAYYRPRKIINGT